MRISDWSSDVCSSDLAERRFVDNWNYFDELGPYLRKRSAKLWAGTMNRGTKPPEPPRVIPDIVVDRRYAFEQGGRRFEVISTPGGEALESLCVWLPAERIVFTGNLDRKSTRLDSSH